MGLKRWQLPALAVANDSARSGARQRERSRARENSNDEALEREHQIDRWPRIQAARPVQQPTRFAGISCRRNIHRQWLVVNGDGRIGRPNPGDGGNRRLAALRVGGIKPLARRLLTGLFLGRGELGQAAAMGSPRTRTMAAAGAYGSLRRELASGSTFALRTGATGNRQTGQRGQRNHCPHDARGKRAANAAGYWFADHAEAPRGTRSTRLPIIRILRRMETTVLRRPNYNLRVKFDRQSSRIRQHEVPKGSCDVNPGSRKPYVAIMANVRNSSDDYRNATSVCDRQRRSNWANPWIPYTSRSDASYPD